MSARALAALVAVALAADARAGSPAERARDAELLEVRRQVASEVQLSAYDLIDELVYGWTEAPVFDTPTPVVLAGVTVPVGLGTGMQALLETHLSAVLIANPTSHVQLVHCPACTQVVVHSGPEATVVSRGIDDPALLGRLGVAGSERHALFVDIEAEGSFLVLRARLTRLDPDLPIVWSRTISTSSNTPALLRAGDGLKSAAEAREEYVDALRDRGPLSLAARIGIRTYAKPGTDQGTPPPPFLWVDLGAEYATTDAQAWLASVVVGGSFIPQAYQGLLVEGRVEHLLTGRARSHVRPDLYLFTGGAVMTVWGPATAAFQTEVLTSDDLLTASAGKAPRFTLGTLEVGLDVRLGHRVGIGAYLETLPYLRNSQNIGRHVRVLGVSFQSLGTEVSLWF